MEKALKAASMESEKAGKVLIVAERGGRENPVASAWGSSLSPILY